MNGSELAALMAELGAYVAFNLDGGGSSQMWLDGEGLVNQPSDGSARPVANHWGVFASGEGDAVSCVRNGGDSGEPDAGSSPDAGPISEPDAGGGGAYPDAGGAGSAGPQGAGGCRTAPSGTAPPVVLALALIAASRRRRSA